MYCSRYHNDILRSCFLAMLFPTQKQLFLKWNVLDYQAFPRHPSIMNLEWHVKVSWIHLHVLILYTAAATVTRIHRFWTHAASWKSPSNRLPEKPFRTQARHVLLESHSCPDEKGQMYLQVPWMVYLFLMKDLWITSVHEGRYVRPTTHDSIFILSRSIRPCAPSKTGVKA